MKNSVTLIILLLVSLAIGYLIYWNDNRKGIPVDPEDVEKLYIDSLHQEQRKIKRYAHAIDSIRMRQYNDSLVFVARLRAFNQEIKRLKNNVEKVNYSYFTAHELDSIGEWLYPKITNSIGIDTIRDRWINDRVLRLSYDSITIGNKRYRTAIQTIDCLHRFKQ